MGIINMNPANRANNTNLVTAIRTIDEYDILGIIYSILTKEIDYPIECVTSHEEECEYKYQDVHHAISRMRETFGEDIIKEFYSFLNYMQTEYYYSFESACLTRGLIPQKKLIIEKRLGERPYVKSNFTSEFIMEELLNFYHKNKKSRRK